MALAASLLLQRGADSSDMKEARSLMQRSGSRNRCVASGAVDRTLSVPLTPNPSPEGRFLLGRCMRLGRAGFEAQPSQGVALIRSSARDGCIEAMNEMGEVRTTWSPSEDRPGP
jgi:hypothetical protein